MNTQIIYEATNDITPFSLPFIIICLFFILSLIYSLRVWKNSDFGGRLGLVLIPLILAFAIIIQFINFFKVEQLFWDFKHGNCEVAEGKIENYEQYYEVGTMSKEDYPDRFWVDDTEFIVYGYSTYGLEYFLRQADGSPLEEGQNVRIYYIFAFYQNLIFKVELLE